MNTPLPEDEDARLRLLLQAAATAPPADDGFSEAVMARIARESRRRRLVLGSAAVAGLLVAAPQAWLLARELGVQFAALAHGWGIVGAVLQSPLGLAAGLLAVAAPGLLQWLDE